MTLVMFASCADTPVYSNPDEVSFSSSAAKMVSSSSTWESGDEIGVYMITDGSSSLAGSAVKYTTTSSSASTGRFTSTSPHLWSVDENPTSGYDFYLHFPFTQALTTDHKANINVSGTSQQVLDGSDGNLDFLYAKKHVATKPVGGSVSVTLTHQLSRIKIVLKLDPAMYNNSPD